VTSDDVFTVSFASLHSCPISLKLAKSHTHGEASHVGGEISLEWRTACWTTWSVAAGDIDLDESNADLRDG